MSTRGVLRLLAPLAAALVCATALAQQLKIPRVDEGAADASWGLFRNRLINALEKHDRGFLLRMTDRNVRNTAEGKRGIAEFRKQWDLGADAGYVPAEHIRSPVELAACAVKEPAGWRMVTFAPAGGD